MNESFCNLLLLLLIYWGDIRNSVPQFKYWGVGGSVPVP